MEQARPTTQETPFVGLLLAVFAVLLCTLLVADAHMADRADERSIAYISPTVHNGGSQVNVIHMMETGLEFAKVLEDKNFRSLTITSRYIRINFESFEGENTRGLATIVEMGRQHHARVVFEAQDGYTYVDVFVELMYKGAAVRLSTYGERKDVAALALPGVGKVEGTLRVLVDPRTVELAIKPVAVKA
jgi:hypothetical protein